MRTKFPKSSWVTDLDDSQTDRWAWRTFSYWRRALPIAVVREVAPRSSRSSRCRVTVASHPRAIQADATAPRDQDQRGRHPDRTSPRPFLATLRKAAQGQGGDHAYRIGRIRRRLKRGRGAGGAAPDW